MAIRQTSDRLRLATGLALSLLLIGPSGALAQNYRLSGLISLRDGASMAILEMPDATQVTVRAGHTLPDGTVVVAIDSTSLTLETGSARTVLTLKGAQQPVADVASDEILSREVDTRLMRQWELLIADEGATDGELLQAFNASLGLDANVQSVRTLGGEAEVSGTSMREVFSFVQRYLSNGEGVKLHLTDSPTSELYLMPLNQGG